MKKFYIKHFSFFTYVYDFYVGFIFEYSIIYNEILFMNTIFVEYPIDS